MKRKMLFSFLITSVLSVSLFFISASQTNRLNVDSKLAQYVKTIQSFPEGKNLIASVLAEGQLNIEVADNEVAKHFKACWNQDSRTIYISLFRKPPEGEIISSILFELHNATVTLKMDHLDQLALEGKMNKQQYIRSFEHLEYLNSINTAKIAQIGIEKGIFPKNALLPTYKDFDEHFYYQQVSGHSDVIAQNYDMLMEQYFN